MHSHAATKHDTIDANDKKPTELTRPAWSNVAADQRIIDGLVAGDPKLFGDLTRGGVSEESIRAHARGLGLTDQFIKQCRLSGSRPAMRECVKCEQPFLSSGVHNRLCRRCPQR